MKGTRGTEAIKPRREPTALRTVQQKGEVEEGQER